MNQLFKRLCISSLKPNQVQVNNIHTGIAALAWSKSEEPKRFLLHNKKIYPPQSSEEEPRPAVSYIEF